MEISAEIFDSLARNWQENQTWLKVYISLAEICEASEEDNKGGVLMVMGPTLHGHREDPAVTHLREYHHAKLHALRKGVVLVTFADKQDNLYCGGILHRETDQSAKSCVYRVKAFSEATGGRWIGNASFDKLHQPVEGLAMLFHYGWHRDHPPTLGITSERWRVMEAWIEHWLG